VSGRRGGGAGRDGNGRESEWGEGGDGEITRWRWREGVRGMRGEALVGGVDQRGDEEAQQHHGPQARGVALLRPRKRAASGALKTGSRALGRAACLEDAQNQGNVDEHYGDAGDRD
jgi:hypothetical protein